MILSGLYVKATTSSIYSAFYLLDPFVLLLSVRALLKLLPILDSLFLVPKVLPAVEDFASF